MELEELEIIVWLYPESKLKNLFGFDLLKNDEYQGNPVTEYDASVVVKRTVRQKLTTEFITQINKSKRIFVQNCDSCVLYRLSEFDWYASTIGHEGIFLINDDSKKNECVLNGFNATLKKPDFW